MLVQWGDVERSGYSCWKLISVSRRSSPSGSTARSSHPCHGPSPSSAIVCMKVHRPASWYISLENIALFETVNWKREIVYHLHWQMQRTTQKMPSKIMQFGRSISPLDQRVWPLAHCYMTHRHRVTTQTSPFYLSTIKSWRKYIL